MTAADRYKSFLVRLWCEPPATACAWQGEIEHIQSGRCWKFDSAAALLDFLRLRIDDLSTPSAPAQTDEGGPDAQANL